MAKTCGVRPLVVRRIPTSVPVRYEIILGAQSWVAAQRAGLLRVPAEILDLTDDAAIRLMGEEGGQRPNPLAAAQTIAESFAENPGLRITALAAREGLSRPTVSHRHRLLRLAPAVQALLRAGEIKEGHARPLISLPATEQLRLARRIVREKLSCRAVEKLARVTRGEPTPAAASSVPSSNTPPPAKDVDQLRAEQMISDHFACRAEYRDDGRTLTVAFHHHDPEVRDGILARLGVSGM
ncbi:MAG: ParB/RepB/Spo0J family partition protein [Acidiferrobacterales bacterium]